MGKTTIGWTATLIDNVWHQGFTFNPWIGCFKVSPGCTNCYAESDNKRYNPNEHLWGPAGHSVRRVTSPVNWKRPYQWNREAEKLGTPLKVFCASMADVFEDYPAQHILDARTRLWTVIEETPNLIWQLLTKRPENVREMVPERWYQQKWTKHGWPEHVWLGTSVENQEMAEQRIPLLVDTFAHIIFLSVEPLLGPVDLSKVRDAFMVDWVIVGGESGPNHRPMDLDWVRAIRDYCQRQYEMAFFFKQVGGIRHDSGGRLLDGRTWDEFPI